jgi:hypothetical protein
MEHVVFYPSADGSPAFCRVGSLDEAVNFVEHLRNVEGITDFSVHALTAVPLSFRAYYHVEVPADELPDAAVAAVAPVEVPVEMPAAIVTEVPAQVAPAASSLPPTPFAPAPEPVLADAAVTQAPMAEAALVEAVTAEAAAPESAVAESSPEETSEVEPFPASVEPVAVAEAEPSGPPMEAADASASPLDGQQVVDPSVEEVVPVPTGRRSMGFFARS